MAKTIITDGTVTATTELSVEEVVARIDAAKDETPELKNGEDEEDTDNDELSVNDFDLLEGKVKTDEEEKELADAVLAALRNNDKLIEIVKEMLSDKDAIDSIPDEIKEGVDMSEVLSYENMLSIVAESIAKLHRFGMETASFAVVTLTVLARADSALTVGYLNNIMERSLVFKLMMGFGDFFNKLKK